MAGNWKMNTSLASGVELARAVRASRVPKDVEVWLAPPATALAAVAEAVAGSEIAVAAQTCHWADAGAFTGEISPAMVAEVASGVILGHSERRALFGETDEGVNRKVHAALAHGLTPFVCVGETLEQRDAGRTDAVVLGQLDAGLAGIADDEAARLVLAYEPVWAIGTGRACDTDEAGRVCGLLRARVAETFGDAAAEALRVLYGGSVKPTNVAGYLAQADIDGGLVGGASLDAASFAALVGATAA